MWAGAFNSAHAVTDENNVPAVRNFIEGEENGKLILPSRR